MKYTLVMLFSFLIHLPSWEGWDIFAKVKFTEKYFAEQKEYYLVPLLDSRIRYYEGKEMTLQGYYLPFDMPNKFSIVISKYPYSMCFFCGGSGPESVAEVVFAEKPPKFKKDQVIRITGTLRLNDSDVNRLNFILEQARLEN
jgi:hypothetical protein